MTFDTASRVGDGHIEAPYDFDRAFEQLFAWCRSRDFAGYDPFDGLNSRIFQATPLTRSRIARLFWTQLIKRSPFDFRRLLNVPPERNAKGMALFALAALARCRQSRTKQAEEDARQLLVHLLTMRIEGFSGAAWGYNFDWQSRTFFAPRGTPNVVTTAFAARSMIEAAHVFRDNKYLSTARSACDFILRDLAVTENSSDAVCFSYSPNSATRIFNANLLAAEVLAEVSALTGEQELCIWARRATRYVVEHQNEDGSWGYGVEPQQSWIDNFHTAFVLYSLSRVIRTCKLGQEYAGALRRGYEFWRSRFFLADGCPKYYHDKLYPADAHAAASAIVTFLELDDFDPDALKIAEQVAHWGIKHLRDPAGFFYYQRRRFLTVRNAYMRWSQAWMLYALARLLEEKSRQHSESVSA